MTSDRASQVVSFEASAVGFAVTLLGSPCMPELWPPAPHQAMAAPSWGRWALLKPCAWAMAVALLAEARSLVGPLLGSAARLAALLCSLSVPIMLSVLALAFAGPPSAPACL